ncbi:helix-turn-helix domain-containing protein [Marinibactrum halimedae]|uniref:AraC family transcriptional regulator n=1 Tax=Marinibactrum halimedae TaxID=1444977 RepID=A0AA37T031_9GAMM|nr:helix-turn-helix domain-containing protein [Marinibactrum halimedae]MCD9461056.1 helix-turn-helix domain-containing protein [Marinibactrum halimedae]GLS24434.1 AraC family transcriptional regulator [Marinibactrum halimedae]
MRAEEQIFEATEYIERNLVSTITAPEIAEHSCLSLRQMYRLFQKHTGDSVQSYVRTRRLTEASRQLIESPRNILDIALEFQFQSAEVFTRAFRRLFWVSPKNFRSIGSPYNATQRNPMTPSDLSFITQSCTHPPKIIELPQLNIVGHHCIQPHYSIRVDDNPLHNAMMLEEVQRYQQQIGNKVDAQPWHVSWRQTSNMTFHNLNNFFGVHVSEPDKHPSFFSSLRIPANTYAVFSHSSSQTSVDFTIMLAHHWIKNSQYHYGDGPALFRAHDNQSQVGELYLPISKQLSSYMDWWQGYDAFLTQK